VQGAPGDGLLPHHTLLLPVRPADGADQVEGLRAPQAARAVPNTAGEQQQFQLTPAHCQR